MKELSQEHIDGQCIRCCHLVAGTCKDSGGPSDGDRQYFFPERILLLLLLLRISTFFRNLLKVVQWALTVLHTCLDATKALSIYSKLGFDGHLAIDEWLQYT
jgi:hypothetical protein